MHRERDFDTGKEISKMQLALMQDIELEKLLGAMSAGDSFLKEISKIALVSGLASQDEILYRQQVLRDCLRHAAVVREMYEVTLNAVKGEKKVYFGFFSEYPSSILGRAVQVLTLFFETLKKLKSMADNYHQQFESDGFKTLFAMLRQELSSEYLATVQSHLSELKFSHGVLVGARLGEGNTPSGFILHRQRRKKRGLLGNIVSRNRRQFTYTLPDRDMNGAREMSELRDRSINLVANATAVSADHILAFLNMLRTELAFYIGCINLKERLAGFDLPICFPSPVSGQAGIHRCIGLYDASLALELEGKVISNDFTADGKELVIITGANRGGKSTFLRSVGLAQLMMQCGMFVPATSFEACPFNGVYTHFRREEDATMNSGKLDEELSRMSAIAGDIRPESLLLLNESFASTNEREGSEIAKQIIRAVLEHHVRIFFVTHFFEMAGDLYRQKDDRYLFLLAERKADGSRSFKIREGAPLPTSYGEDLYVKIFGNGDRPVTAKKE